MKIFGIAHFVSQHDSRESLVIARQFGHRMPDEPLQAAIKCSNSWNIFSLRGNIVQNFGWIGKLSKYFGFLTSFPSMTAASRS